MMRVVAGLYRLEAAGFVNAYLIEGSSDLTLVDTGHSRSAEALAAEIKGNGFALEDIGRIVITHAHADHAGGLTSLLDLRPYKVYAHPSDIPVLTGKEARPSFKGPKGFFLDFYHEQLLPWRPVETALPADPKNPPRGLPQWQVLHVPGHTGGSLALFDPVLQILISGDAVSNHKGRLHIPEACFNQDHEAARASVKALSELDTDILCPGHGPIVRGGAFRLIEGLLKE